VGQQAVALRVSGDKAQFYNVAVLGAQDTLYDHQGRHYFQNCFIQGSIDFIFGNGRSYYKDSHLHSIATSFGSLTAQKRNETYQKTGFSFVNAYIDGTGIVYLGRAWGNFSRVVYSWSYLNSMILPEGWNDWGIATRQT
jgi:pectinesterase